MEILFILFLIIAIIAGIVAAESDNFFFSTGVIISFFAALEWLFAIPIWATIVTNPLTVIMLLLGYLVVGSVYTMIWRWPEYLRYKSPAIRTDFARLLRDKKVATIEEYMELHDYKHHYSASSNKDYIANWVLAWPFSMTWELSRKPAIWVWNNMYRVLANSFERIGKLVTARILKDK